MPTRPEATPPVIVGADDSPASIAALRLAASEAAFRGSRLFIVPLRHGSTTGHLDLIVADLQAERRAAGEPPVEAELTALEGNLVDQLCTFATGAALLVLGHIPSLSPSEVVESLADEVVGRPPCPVLIVPAS